MEFVVLQTRIAAFGIGSRYIPDSNRPRPTINVIILKIKILLSLSLNKYKTFIITIPNKKNPS
jgi:hypothetical protein